MNPRAFGYCRVSTDEQYNTHLSIDDQRRRIIEFCEKESLDLGNNYARLGEESASAYKLRFDERPLGALLSANMFKSDHIVIAKLDRAFRDMIDAVKTVEFWMDKGVIVHILDMPFSGQPIFDKLILGILAWCAEFESHRKSERLVDAYRSARRSGAPMQSRAHIGFRWRGSRKQGNKRLEYWPQEREHMTLMWELWTEHELSLWEIASYLMCKKVVPYDKRDPNKIKLGSKQTVAQEYTPRRIALFIRTEAEFRFYEAQGKTPAEAAAAWLYDWGHDQLPSEAEVRAAVLNGGATCKS